MIKLIVFVFYFSSVLCSTIRTKPFFSEIFAEQHFNDFIIKYNKNYDSLEEKTKRFEIFKMNLRKINELNEKHENTIYAVTKFADLTLEEFSNKNTKPDMSDNNVCVPFNMDGLNEAPEAFDWRSKDALTPPKDQGNCGSCWAQAATGSIESQYLIKYQQQLDLSIQQLVDCDTDSMGCSGGYPFSALSTLIKEGGQMLTKDYPYTERNGKCKFDSKKVVANVTSCYNSNVDDEEVLKKVLFNYGPLAMGMDDHTIQFYHGGIAKACDKNANANHAVLLVGYGTENNTPYWIMKNSYGTDYGEGGYFRIERGIRVCDMMEQPFTSAVIA